MHSPYILPKYMPVDLPRDTICSVACFRLGAHTLQVETVTWNRNTPPLPLTCAMLSIHQADNILDEQHVLFTTPCKYNICVFVHHTPHCLRGKEGRLCTSCITFEKET